MSLELGSFMLGHVQTELPLAPAAEPAVLASVFLVMLHVFVPQHRRLRKEGTNLVHLSNYKICFDTQLSLLLLSIKRVSYSN